LVGDGTFGAGSVGSGGGDLFGSTHGALSIRGGALEECAVGGWMLLTAEEVEFWRVL
jgi:hypothetical protein